ncbi:MAG TPA: HAD-IB family hydrolase [Candidatus Acidoferrales bacterium]|nr:HAD-IB family hydrolase [Candidatus Acidoferrales bacterium]
MNGASKVGAFFDLDGTVLPAPSIERRFLRYTISRGKLGPAQMLRWAARFVRMVAVDPRAATQGNKAHFTEMSTGVAREWEVRLSTRPLQFFSAGLRLLEWHAARGHRIFLVTGAPEPLAEIAARRLPVPVEIVATQLEERNGRWTGILRGEHICGEAKRRAIERIAATEDVDLTRSFAYGNSYSDVAILESVEFPTVVNPTELLERLAHLRGWPVLEWHATEARAEAVATRAIPPSSEPRRALISIVHPSFGANR